MRSSNCVSRTPNTTEMLSFFFSGKMTKIYSYAAGETLGSHEEFLKRLTRKGIKKVDSPEKSDWTIVFCPIVSRYQTDIDAALSSVPGKRAHMHMEMLQCVLSCNITIWCVFCVRTKGGTSGRKLILVAMHHSYKEDYIFPRSGEDCRGVELHADCLFFDKKGLYECPSNTKAVKMVRDKVMT